MTKTNLLLLLFGFLLVFTISSCEEEANPKAVVRVMESIDSVMIPVSQAFVQVGPATREDVLDEVKDEGYTNSNGYIEFEFDKELILQAIAYKYKRDEQGKVVYIGDVPVVLRSGNRVLVFKNDYTDNKIIENK